MLEKDNLPKSVALVGAYPPPIGGNAIHVQRLAAVCWERGLNCSVADLYGKGRDNGPEWVFRPRGPSFWRLLQTMQYLARRRWDVVHIHVSAMDKFLLAGWFLLLGSARARRRIVTIHSGSFAARMHSRGWLGRAIAAALLRRFAVVVVVNEMQKAFLCNVMHLYERRVKVIPAFIAPVGRRNVELPDSVRRCLKRSHTIVGSGYGKPLYGHLLLIDAVKRLETAGVDVGLIIALYSQYDMDYVSQLKEKARGLQWCAVTEDLASEAFNAILSEADIYVRTTLTDGDSIAVREALFNGCTVVASDCVPRPPEVILFRSGSVDDLSEVLKGVLLEGSQSQPRKTCMPDFSEDVIALYKTNGV